jgi:hypothetical protein
VHIKKLTVILNMKRLAFLFTIVLLSVIVKGQNGVIEVGFEGAPSISFLRGNEILSNNSKLRIGFSCGFFFQYNISRRFSLRSIIAFEQKGSSYSFTNIDTNGYSTVIKGYSNFNYITIPILFRTTFGDKLKFFMDIGPFVGYLISQKNIYKNDFYAPASTYSQYIPFDLGLSCGLGVEIPVTNNLLISCEIRDNLGLLNIGKGEVYNDGSIKTNSTNLLIGFAYKLGNEQK